MTRLTREDLDVLSVDQLKDEVMRLHAIAMADFENTRLVEMHMVDGKLTMNLSGGPIQYMAEYMAEVLGHPEELNNYAEIMFTHHVAGPLVLTLQRQNGKTPHQLKSEAEAEVQRLKRHLNHLYGDSA